jgi:hypothetical protein
MFLAEQNSYGRAFKVVDFLNQQAKGENRQEVIKAASK